MIPRVAGIKHKKPSRSVKKPGVRSTSPPAKIIMPSRTTSPGICPCWSWLWASWKICNPCRLASHAPMTPVEMTRSSVGSQPKFCPAVINPQISSAGMMSNRATSIFNIRFTPFYTSPSHLLLPSSYQFSIFETTGFPLCIKLLAYKRLM